MAPKSSSASAATRKKHAKKSHQQPSNGPDVDSGPAINGPKQKKDKKAPKIKRFIPPPTYTGESDPVISSGSAWMATSGLTGSIPAHLIQRLSEPLELLATVPVLIHHFHRLVVHPSRRVRVLALTLLDTFVSYQHDQDHPCRSVLLNPVELEKPEYIGSWIISLWDPDKTARAIATKIWNEVVDLDVEESTIISRRERPSGSGTSQSTPRKVAILPESSESTSCRLRASAFEALAHLLQIHPIPQKTFDLITDSSIGQRHTWELITPGKNQEPMVRRAIWTLIQTLTTRQDCRPLLDALLPVFSFSALDAAFTERDFGVQGTMIIGLVGLLRIYPSLWWGTSQSISSQSINPSEDNDPTLRVERETSSDQPSIITRFYTFLELGCPSNPTLLYPALILVVASFPVTVEHTEQFFTRFWAAFDSRALRASGARGLKEFYSSWSECLLFFEKELGDQANPVIQSQLSKAWAQLIDSTDPVDPGFNALSSAIVKVMHKSKFGSEYAWSFIETAVQAGEDEQKTLRYLKFLSKARMSHPSESLGMKAEEASVTLCQRVLNHFNSLAEVTLQAPWIPVVTIILQEESAGRILLQGSSTDSLTGFCRDRLPEACIVQSDASLKLPKLELDRFVTRCLEGYLEGNTTYQDIIEAALTRPQLFIQEETIKQILCIVANELHVQTRVLLHNPHSSTPTKLHIVLPMCNLHLQHLGGISPALRSTLSSTLKQVAVDMFSVESFLPLMGDDSEGQLVKIAHEGYSLALELHPATELPDAHHAILHYLATASQMFSELARYSNSTSSCPAGTGQLLSEDELKSIVSAVDTNTTYLVSSLSAQVTPSWHENIILKLDRPENHLPSETDPLKILILNLAIESRREATKELATVALHKVLSTLFKYSDTRRKTLKNGSNSPNRFKANTEGLNLIKVLCATAPPSDSIHIFLPQQRVVFLLQAISGWLKSDDDIGHELNIKLLELFSDLPRSFRPSWGSLGSNGGSDRGQLRSRKPPGKTKSLFCWYGSHVQGCLKLVLGLFCSAPLRSTLTAPIATLLHAIEEVLSADEAQSLYLEVPVSSLVKSIYSPSIRSSVLGLTIAQTAAQHFVDNLAVEIELNPDSGVSPSLPEELLSAIQVSKDDHPRATLMSWVLIFLTSRMRISYSSQLREANLVSENLIPLLHEVLNVAERGKPIDISIWDVPSFDFSLMESTSLKPIPLAAYVYFLALRTVPSQIRSWWEDCRNKQLSMSVVSFISRQFSPILISQELGKFKEPATIQLLSDENMSIKVSPVIKEVKVTYTVDEESMEIVVRIPSDYPLQPVEVLDIRKVGIPDTTWRAWLLVVQQSIANHNGSIAEAIGLFKKNISLHFEGVEACAICYAIISVVDRSLPSKACRTCRNRFHPSCLYKWFSTSHGSSCPLCRSLYACREPGMQWSWVVAESIFLDRPDPNSAWVLADPVAASRLGSQEDGIYHKRLPRSSSETGRAIQQHQKPKTHNRTSTTISSGSAASWNNNSRTSPASQNSSATNSSSNNNNNQTQFVKQLIIRATPNHPRAQPPAANELLPSDGLKVMMWIRLAIPYSLIPLPGSPDLILPLMSDQRLRLTDHTIFPITRRSANSKPTIRASANHSSQAKLAASLLDLSNSFTTKTKDHLPQPPSITVVVRNFTISLLIPASLRHSFSLDHSSSPFPASTMAEYAIVLDCLSLWATVGPEWPFSVILPTPPCLKNTFRLILPTESSNALFEEDTQKTSTRPAVVHLNTFPPLRRERMRFSSSSRNVFSPARLSLISQNDDLRPLSDESEPEGISLSDEEDTQNQLPQKHWSQDAKHASSQLSVSVHHTPSTTHTIDPHPTSMDISFHVDLQHVTTHSISDKTAFILAIPQHVAKNITLAQWSPLNGEGVLETLLPLPQSSQKDTIAPASPATSSPFHGASSLLKGIRHSLPPRSKTDAAVPELDLLNTAAPFLDSNSDDMQAEIVRDDSDWISTSITPHQMSSLFVQANQTAPFPRNSESRNSESTTTITTNPNSVNSRLVLNLRGQLEISAIAGEPGSKRFPIPFLILPSVDEHTCECQISTDFPSRQDLQFTLPSWASFISELADEQSHQLRLSPITSDSVADQVPSSPDPRPTEPSLSINQLIINSASRLKYHSCRSNVSPMSYVKKRPRLYGSLRSKSNKTRSGIENETRPSLFDEHTQTKPAIRSVEYAEVCITLCRSSEIVDPHITIQFPVGSASVDTLDIVGVWIDDWELGRDQGFKVLEEEREEDASVNIFTFCNYRDRPEKSGDFPQK
ncbi:hypothetical protein H4Q26_015334 [Puccinia striiformis f. sp. tritici PST-130]|nr:hypothetical protein H4Q26_015334 [Puccinia striiformis f. sp. tritici PST-130]